MAFDKIWNFLDDIREFLVGNGGGENIPVKIGRTNEQATVIEMATLTEKQKDSLWLSPKNRDFAHVESAYELLTHRIDGRNFLPPRPSKIVSSFMNTYDYIFSNDSFETSKAADSFKIIIKKEEFDEKKHRSLVKTNRKSKCKVMEDPSFYHELQIICMSPAIAFQDFKEAHSVILASGTMSPLDTFESELGIQFMHKIEANHVIKPEQVFCRHIHSARNGEQLRNTYQNRENNRYLEGLGELIVDVTQEVKSGGILVFFSSYSEMNSKLWYWKK